MADVAADPDLFAAARAEHAAEQGGGGALALGAGDGDDGGAAAFQEQADFGGDRHAGALRGGDEFVGGGKSGGGDDEIGIAEVVEVVTTQAEGDVQAVELLNGVFEFVGGLAIGDQDRCALPGEPACDGDAAAEPAQSRDRDAPAS